MFKRNLCKVRICKHLFDAFPIQNSVKQGDDLLPLLINFDLQYAIKKVQGNEERFELNGTHHFLSMPTILIHFVRT